MWDQSRHMILKWDNIVSAHVIGVKWSSASFTSLTQKTFVTPVTSYEIILPHFKTMCYTYSQTVILKCDWCSICKHYWNALGSHASICAPLAKPNGKWWMTNGTEMTWLFGLNGLKRNFGSNSLKLALGLSSRNEFLLKSLLCGSWQKQL